jgi:hypothetical protein
MIIEESDYRLEQISNSAIFWDLYLLKTIKPKGCASREEFKLEGYGYTLDHAILVIAAYRMHNKHPEEALTMSEYLKEYREIIDELTEKCKKLPIDPDITESNV